jgi:flagellar M-ring protein FliF
MAITGTDNSAADSRKRAAAGAEGASARRVDFLAGFNRLDLMRQLGLMLGLAASIALGFAVVLWSRGEDYQPLYASMQGYDAAELIAVMEAQRVGYRVDPGSGVLLVPSNRVADLRLQVASAGIARDNGYGYEYLDQDQGLGTSQFMEANRYKRSQEGELQRTIAGLRNVQSARVHLATPERSVFVRNSRKPTASVFLTLQPGRQLADMQVRAIANLVASSVPELSPEDVTIVDQQGNLLSKKESSSEIAIAGQQFEYVRRYEETLVNRVSRILQPIAGGRFTAEVAADIDFTRSEQAAETWSPETAALRSEQSLEERRSGGEINGGIPGALSNQPALETGSFNETGALPDTTPAGNSRQQATRNYELDRTVSYTSHDPVTVRRLSVAVLLDDRPGPEGTVPWSEDELGRITALVRDVIGYSAARGDSVTVVNKRFADLSFADEDISTPIWSQPWLTQSLKQVLGGLLVLILVFGVLRPILQRLSALGAESRTLARSAAEGEFADLEAGAAGMQDSVTLTGGDDLLLPGPADGYERQLNAIKGLIAQDPGRVAQVVKQWITDDIR